MIVDYQNDFASPDGALSVPGGEDIAGRINELARSGGFDFVVATRDWHPRDHKSFEERGGIWPVHCVQDTDGAELHPSLERDEVDLIFDKGQNQETDGYSAFETPDLGDLLRDKGIDNITVVGLATDYCVKASGLDAVRLGYETTVLTDAIAAVELESGDGERALDELAAQGVRVERSSDP